MSLGKQDQAASTAGSSDAADTAGERAPGMRLNIVILFMGSRGDLQPSLAIAKMLQRRHGHRVRIASHPPYRAAVEAAGVGFFSIGDTDIKTMMARRLLPKEELEAQVPAIKGEFREMGDRWWQACVDGPDGLGEGEGGEAGFVADLVVSTMQVFNHTSAAARLGVPLHLFGMNPRVYSSEVPHSQAGWALKKPSKWKNALSWWIQDFMFLHTTESVLNDVRVNLMGLEALSPLWWLAQYNRMNVPCTYLWSPRLLPKPTDWADNINVAGFVFEDPAEEYTPPADLAAFLEAGDTPPVYVGFGSMSFANTQEIFEGIIEAARRVGVRAVVCKGWSSLVEEEVAGAGDSSHVFFVDEVPHTWLFPRVRAVVCHGGNGTTAMALRSGKPTLVVPVAGDQPFWGTRVHAIGCGPETTFGVAELTPDGFEEKLRELLRPEYTAAAEQFAAGVAGERPGAEVCVEDLLRTAAVYERDGRCDVYDGRPAVWRTVAGDKLSAVAAHVLVEKERIKREDLRALNVVKWPDLVSPGDPVSGLVLSVQKASGSISGDVKAGAWGRLMLHVLRAPLTVFAAVAFGLFNFLDFTLYKLSSPFVPKLYASNPRLYTYPQMLLFLASSPFVELASVATQPATLARQKRGALRVALEVPLALTRVVLASVNVLVGFIGITSRHVELSCARVMGERPRGDVVAEARVRQGRIEAEALRVEEAEGGRDVFREIVQRWDAKRV